MASEESTLFAPIPTIKAIYIKNNDPWRQLNCDEPHINEKYTPDDFCDRKIVVLSYRKEYPGKDYNTVMFDYQYDDDGYLIDFRADIIRPIMDRYREYLWN